MLSGNKVVVVMPDQNSEKTLTGGMPFYKYTANRFLTLLQNLLIGAKLSEYHTGYRAYRRTVLENLPLGEDSDDFIFDNQILAQSVMFGYRIGEISCPTKYFDDASSISFRRSIRYGFGVLAVSLQFFLQKRLSAKFRIFDRNGKKLLLGI